MNRTSAPRWSRLDNAAKIFPSNTTAKDSKVFRFACQLKEEVDPALLQQALDRTMDRFPLYRSVLKRGLFWYYLEESDLPAEAAPETLPPCAPIHPGERRTLLFRVLYYGRRVSLEVHHALSDGTGALQFLLTLLHFYLLLAHAEDLAAQPPLPPAGSSHDQKRADSFQKYYEKPKDPWRSPVRRAYRLRGERLPEHRVGLVEGKMPLDQVLALARSLGLTATELMAAVLIRAIHEGMRLRDRTKPVVISVPVNLRAYFPSASARNFFATIPVSYDFSRQEDSLEAVAAHVKGVFQASLTQENLRARMNHLCALEHSLPMRLVPLGIKDPVLRIASVLAEKKTTASLSNVGRVPVPPELAPYIDYFDAFSSPNMPQATVCSFGDQYVVCFASPFAGRDMEGEFFRQLVALGLPVTITSNLGQTDEPAGPKPPKKPKKPKKSKSKSPNEAQEPASNHENAQEGGDAP
jgi:hypothetical protein